MTVFVSPSIVAMHFPFVVDIGAGVVVIATDRATAERIDLLIERHGLVDAPDTPEEITQ